MKKLLFLVSICILTGCADHYSLTEAASITQVGFWHGLWHGMILPFSWLISLFDSDVAIYAVYNNGGWYDFGFALGCGSLCCGATTHRKD